MPHPLRANYGKKNWDKHAALVPVGTLEDGKSPYGIYDMAGNAWEWVSDWYDNVYYKNSPLQNPKGPERGDFKVLRGGSWHSMLESLHSANRNYSPPEHPEPRQRVSVRENSVVFGPLTRGSWLCVRRTLRFPAPTKKRAIRAA